MKYISIDIETTGLDSETCQILSVAAIIEDTKTKLPFKDIPKFHGIIKHSEIKGQPFALNMNAKIINILSRYKEDGSNKNELEEEIGAEFYHPSYITTALRNFLVENRYDGYDEQIKIQVAGKNFGTFDKLFLEKLPFWHESFKLKHRILDPAILFVDWENDEELPNLDKCKQRVGLEGLVSHNALEDAYDVIQVLRAKY